MLGQIEFNNKKTYDDFGFVISDISIGDPTPNNIFVSVPYGNGVYDFSCINGDMTYGTREISIRFRYEEFEILQNRINAIYNDFKKNLYSETMEMLKVSWMRGFFMAKLSSISPVNLLEEERIVETTFIAQPFRTYENYEGDDIWDTFNFLTDYTQYNEHSVNGYKIIDLYNLSSKKCIPDIVCDSKFTIEFKGNEYRLNSGINKCIQLDIGKNTITCKGIGNIRILWRREVI